MRQIAGALGVGHVLEGSVRKGGSQVRITVQLVNAVTGVHEWADRYDRQLEDVFEVQDEITRRVAAILSERIWQAVARSIREKSPAQYGPYEWAFSAIGLIHHVEPDSNETAISHCRKALEHEPDLVQAHLGLGFGYYIDWAYMGNVDGAALEKAEHHAHRFRELSPDDANANAYRLLSRIFLATGRLEEAKRCVERSLAINCFDGDILLNKGLYILFAENAEQSMPWFDRVIEIHDETPHTVDFARMWKTFAHFASADYASAVSQMKDISSLRYLRSLIGAACFAQLGDCASAGTAAETAVAAHPGLRVCDLGFYRCFQDQEVRTRLSDALVKAGIPA